MIHLSSLQIFIIYWIYTIIVETIYYYNLIKSEIKKLRAVPEYDLFFKTFIEQIKQVAYMRLSLKRMFNPFTYFLMYLVFCVLCPILFPYNVFNVVKRIFGYKSDLEKRAEEAANEYYAGLGESNEKKSTDMEEYVHKQNLVKAFQFTNEMHLELVALGNRDENPFDVTLGNHKLNAKIYWNSNIHGLFLNAEEKTMVFVGDWIIEDKKGRYKVMSDSEFKENYE